MCWNKRNIIIIEPIILLSNLTVKTIKKNNAIESAINENISLKISLIKVASLF